MTALLLDRAARRGACPGLSAPMPTGDGLLVRLLPTGTIPAGTFLQLCAAAREYGNGVIEITGRGSIQVRGLSAASAPPFASAVAGLGIVADDGISVLTGALAGLDASEILDAGALAGRLRHALLQSSLTARLAPKVSVVVDGGDALGLAEISADVRLCAETAGDGAVLRIAVGGDQATAIPLGAVTADRAIDAVICVLEVLARRGRATRARDVLVRDGAPPFHSALADVLIANPPAVRTRRPGADAIGMHRLRDGSLARGLGLAFGHADAMELQRLAEATAKAGATGVRAAPPRVLMVIGLAQMAVSSFVAAAANLGFIVKASDPRRQVIACAGAPICSSAHLASRSLGPLAASIVGSSSGGQPQVHISGCAKSCAHSGSAALTVIGSSTGCALVANGTTRDAPFATIDESELPAAIERYFRGPMREVGLV